MWSRDRSDSSGFPNNASSAKKAQLDFINRCIMIAKKKEAKSQDTSGALCSVTEALGSSGFSPSYCLVIVCDTLIRSNPQGGHNAARGSRCFALGKDTLGVRGQISRYNYPVPGCTLWKHSGYVLVLCK